MASIKVLQAAVILSMAHSFLAACSTFVASTGSRGLRGVQAPTSAVEFVPFQSGMPGAGSEEPRFLGAKAMMLAAALGLLAGMAPVWAEELSGKSGSVESARKFLANSAAGEEMRSITETSKAKGPSKAERLKRQKEQLAQLQQEEEQKEAEKSKKKSK
mmetsp:Transcript_24852/g.44995  ORF Transcript_24852/g.44995 Transcript_24852/m.44995 type:complete len:159 (+) Transcript_24852:50-526(+)|eukprot:CAMPEP_0197668732 /NCGR_PEP_ID=MMETSP1338-20131121/70150_1 /TAXON_ID=43686 ORGANISM="Pelagodinium beii, Strain RCC1491" /NCGR_SAMPLE_ID=MMETSP1338 /ASSEMBLY_ACC=CAM_ASM_000754 /LENGTH=158 /DNA_ID=CAMNT_0043248183 /DNA_START=12 /DNA_END=488 /DNA_ORIENTATION=+